MRESEFSQTRRLRRLAWAIAASTIVLALGSCTLRSAVNRGVEPTDELQVVTTFLPIYSVH